MDGRLAVFLGIAFYSNWNSTRRSSSSSGYFNSLSPESIFSIKASAISINRIHTHKRRHFRKERYEKALLSLNLKKETKIEPTGQDQENPKTIFDHTERDHLATEQNVEDEKLEEVKRPPNKSSTDIEIKERNLNPDANNSIPVEENKQQEVKPAESVNDAGSVICTICQLEFEENEIIVHLDCGKLHIFHCECLKEWFKVKLTCPTCRKDVIEMYKNVAGTNAALQIDPKFVKGVYAEDLADIQERVTKAISCLEDEECSNFDTINQKLK